MKKQIVILLICHVSFSFQVCSGELSLLDSLIIRHNDYGTYGIYTQPYDSSKAFFEDEIKICEKHGFWDLALGAVNYLASIADRYQQFDDMGTALRKGNALLKFHKDYLESVDTSYSVRYGYYIQLAVYNARISKFKVSEQILLDLLRKLTKTAGADQSALFTTYAQIADLYLDVGFYEKAYPYYLLMGKSIPSDEYHDYYEFDHLQYLSSYFVRMRDYKAAKQILTSALHKKYVKSVNAEWNERVTSFYELLSKTYQGLKLYDSAVFYLRKSLALQEKHSPTLMYTYEAFGDCYSYFKKHSLALVYYRKVDSLYRKSSSFSSFRQAQILGKIGESQFNLKDYPGALKSVQSAFHILYNDSSYLRDVTKNPPFASTHADKVFIKLFIVKSDALAQLASKNTGKYSFRSSVQSYLITANLIDRFRHEISTDDFKQLFVTEIRPMYEKAVKACWFAWEKSHEDSFINRAYYFMEKSKYQILLDAINTGDAEYSGGLPKEFANRAEEYKVKLISQQNMITMLELKGKLVQLEKLKLDYAQTRNKYEAFLDTVEKMYPDYYNLKFNDKVQPIGYLKKKIGNKVFIEYLMADDFIAIIGADRNKTFFKLTPADRPLYTSLNELLGSLQESPHLSEKMEDVLFRDFTVNSTHLYKVLFKEIQANFKGSRNFIIVTDGLLGYLPFEILLEKYTGNRQNYGRLEYLMKSCVIGYEYSGTILLQKSKKAKPHFIHNYIGFAPESRTSDSRIVKIPGMPFSISLGPLQFSGPEIKAAESVFKGKLYTGTNADVSQFRKNSGNARIIHFAGHTIVNDSLPGLSCLLFSTPLNNDKQATVSPAIFSNEILNLDLNADLVILSTCESGTGKLSKGEGLISIGRSFRYAGAKSMVMTMWKINDQSAAQIINIFCRNLRKGKTGDLALHNAKTAYLKNADDRFNHPYYWAAFIFTGDDEPIVKRGILWMIPLILILLLAIFYAISSFARRRISFTSRIFFGYFRVTE